MIMAPIHNVHSAMTEIPQSHKHMARDLKHRPEQSFVPNVMASTTLQSVLRGEVPSAYRHLATSRPSAVTFGEESSPHSPQSHAHFHTENSLLTSEGEMHRTQQFFEGESERFIPSSHSSSSTECLVQIVPSVPSHHHAVSRSPHERVVSPFIEPTFVYGSHYQEGSPSSVQYYAPCSPGYDSRSSPFRESGSPFINQGSSPYHIDASPYQNTGSPFRPCSPHRYSDSPVYSPQSPYSQDRYSSSDIKDSYMCDEQPMDLSCKSDNGGSSPVYHSGNVDTQISHSEGSMLRNLLSSGKQRQFSSRNPDSDRDSPCSDVYKPDVTVTSSTRVTLAKKMVYPITSRVSDWLVKIVQFTKAIPEFSSMSQNDKMTLLINAWTRLLLLLMAENEFEFAVTPLPIERQCSDAPPTQDEPTMKSVESIQSFIKKCKNMSLDQKEYALLRMAVLFNAGYVGLDNLDLVEKLNSAVQQLLQQHVADTRPGDVMHYSRILMCLPSLYGINCRMVENLFCTRINSSMDMEVLLKEMLQNL